MDLQFIGRSSLLLVMLLLSAVTWAQSAGEAGSSDIPYSRKGADTCLACHDDEITFAVFQTRHGVPTDPRSPFGHAQLQCESCHGAGGAHAPRVRRGQERPPVISFGPDDKTPVATQNSMCLDCHDADVGFGWHAGPHDTDEVACADCHVSHAPRDPVLQTATQPDVCFDCHQLQRSETLKAFSHPFFEGKNGLCRVSQPAWRNNDVSVCSSDAE